MGIATKRSKLVRITGGQIEWQCGTCRRPIFLYPCETRRSIAFCSHSCCAEWKKTLKGARAGGWKGGLMLSGGRMSVYVPDHPHANCAGYVLRYRLVAEQKLGRYLLPEEVVHHRDENKGNDDPENLEVFASEAEHQRYHGRKRGGINGAPKQPRA